MRWIAKIAVVLLCYALCGVAAFFVASSPQGRLSEPRRTNAIPVKNHELVRRVWIVAARL
jgi:hypothetical protein